MHRRFISIIISSYNYEDYLPTAIDSALDQTYPHVEVIVVDDGSSDGSLRVIEGYGNQITPIIKENGGQASVFNAGFAVSQGDVIHFLDSDDALLPTAMKQIAAVFEDEDIAKVHWPLIEIDRLGKETGRIVPAWGTLSRGDLRDRALTDGPGNYVWPPTSGNAFKRYFIEQVLPMPERMYRTFPDYFLCSFAQLFGKIEAIDEPQGYYRLHDANHSHQGRIDQRIDGEVEKLDYCYRVASTHRSWGNTAIDIAAWRDRSWKHELQNMISRCR